MNSIKDLLRAMREAAEQSKPETDNEPDWWTWSGFRLYKGPCGPCAFANGIGYIMSDSGYHVIEGASADFKHIEICSPANVLRVLNALEKGARLVAEATSYPYLWDEHAESILKNWDKQAQEVEAADE